MNRLWILVGAVALISLVACRTVSDKPKTGTSNQGAHGESAQPELANSEVVICNPKGQAVHRAVSLSSHLPFEAVVPKDMPNDKQCIFDVFSWNSFIALAHGEGGEFAGTPVWQSWPQSSDIFLPHGAKPAPWPGERVVPEECRNLVSAENLGALPIFSQLGKNQVLEATDQPFKSGPLIDVNGNYSRFMIAVNEVMYEEILKDGLYSKKGQADFTRQGKEVNFSCSCDPSESSADDEPSKRCPDGGRQGAVMVKAAWKILDDQKDDVSTFHQVQSLVVTPEKGKAEKSCRVESLGLVGFHIAHKTQDRPQWIWSTFEHRANAPREGQEVSKTDRFNYFQPGCSDCNAVNEPPPQPWTPHLEPETENRRKSQLRRVATLSEGASDAAKRVNAAAHRLLDGTVWAHYELISTQWPTAPESIDPEEQRQPSPTNGWCRAVNPNLRGGRPAPQYLANLTLESYIQGKTQGSSNCISCHLRPTLEPGVSPGPQDPSGFADFTFLLERAK